MREEGQADRRQQQAGGVDELRAVPFGQDHQSEGHAEGHDILLIDIVITNKFLFIGINMRKSRLSLFKSTSMLISVVGIIMIIATVIVVAYVGYSVVSTGITNEISSGTQYDELAQLQSEYNNLSAKFDSIKATYYAGGADDVKIYNDAKLEAPEGIRAAF